MITEQNKQKTLKKKYNLFSPNQAIEVYRGSSSLKKQKVEIKLVFHHPNLLFLNSKKIKSKQETSKQVGDYFIRDKKERNKYSSQKYNNLRPYTSYQPKEYAQLHKRFNSTTLNMKRRQHEDGLQVFGKSSYLKQNINSSKLNLNPSKTTFNQFEKTHNDEPQFYIGNENLFQFLESKEGNQKKALWNQLIHDKGNRYPVKLNMYLDAQKKYLKYSSKYR